MSILPAALALILVAGAQWWVLRGLGRRVPVGDEQEYLARAASGDPHAPGFFLRPPGMAFVARLFGSENRIRGALVAAGILTAAVVAAAAWTSGGHLAALVALAWMLVPERLLLACHLWPDTLLGLVAAGVVLVFSLADPSAAAPLVALAVLAMVGTLTRIDFVLVAPLSGLALAASGRPLALEQWLLLVGPTVAAVTLWWFRNGLLYARWQFEDTWTFNVVLAGEQAALSPAGRGFEPEAIVARVSQPWSRLPGSVRVARARRILVWLLARPLRLLDRAARRTVAFAGPDTFLRELVLPADAAYPELSTPMRRRAELLLRLGFPLLFAFCLVGALLTRTAPPLYLLPFAGTVIGSILFHLRTRYRVALIPPLALFAAELAGSIARFLNGRSIAWAVLFTALGLGVAWLLARVEFGREVDATQWRETPG